MRLGSPPMIPSMISRCSITVACTRQMGLCLFVHVKNARRDLVECRCVRKIWIKRLDVNSITFKMFFNKYCPFCGQLVKMEEGEDGRQE